MPAGSPGAQHSPEARHSSWHTARPQGTGWVLAAGRRWHTRKGPRRPLGETGWVPPHLWCTSWGWHVPDFAQGAVVVGRAGSLGRDERAQPATSWLCPGEFPVGQMLGAFHPGA